jgi:uncharacterized protein YdaU (DUF1376 family)
VTQLPIMPVLVERLLGDTNHLSNEEMGAYTRLLLNGWLRGARLAEADLQRLAQAPTRNWPRLWKRLRPFFVEMSPNCYTQRGLDRELSRALKNHDANVSRNEKMRAAKANKYNGHAKNDERPTKVVTTPVTKHKAAPKAPVTEIVTAPVTVPVTEIVTALNPDKDRTLPSTKAESSVLATVPPTPTLQAMPITEDEEAAALAALRLKGAQPTPPSPDLLRSPIVKTGNSIMDAINAHTAKQQEDDDGRI